MIYFGIYFPNKKINKFNQLQNKSMQVQGFQKKRIDTNSEAASNNSINLSNNSMPKKTFYKNSPQLYSKLIKKVQHYETDHRKITSKFNRFQKSFPNLPADEVIELVKQYFKGLNSKFQNSGKNSKKEYNELIAKYSLDQNTIQNLIFLYFQYESNIKDICHFLNQAFVQSLRTQGFKIQDLSEKDVQLLVITEIKKYLVKIQQITKQRKIVKVFIPFIEIQLNEIAYRFLQVHKGKLYAMDKALAFSYFKTFFCPEFLKNQKLILNKDLQQVYQFVVNMLSAVQSQAAAKNKKPEKQKFFSKIPLENCRISSSNSQLQSNDPSINRLGLRDKMNRFLDERYICIAKFYIECGNWGSVLQRLLQHYGSSFEYFQWSVLQRKVESYLRLIYQLFLARVSKQEQLKHMLNQLPTQGKLKFIYVVTSEYYQPILFKLFYFYLHQKEIQTFHLKEMIDYLIKNKEILCSRKHQLKDLIKEENGVPICKGGRKIKYQTQSNRQLESYNEKEINSHHCDRLLEIKEEISSLSNSELLIKDDCYTKAKQDQKSQKKKTKQNQCQQKFKDSPKSKLTLAQIFQSSKAKWNQDKIQKQEVSKTLWNQSQNIQIKNDINSFQFLNFQSMQLKDQMSCFAEDEIEQGFSNQSQLTYKSLSGFSCEMSCCQKSNSLQKSSFLEESQLINRQNNIAQDNFSITEIHRSKLQKMIRETIKSKVRQKFLNQTKNLMKNTHKQSFDSGIQNIIDGHNENSFEKANFANSQLPNYLKMDKKRATYLPFLLIQDKRLLNRLDFSEHNFSFYQKSNDPYTQLKNEILNSQVQINEFRQKNWKVQSYQDNHAVILEQSQREQQFQQDEEFSLFETQRQSFSIDSEFMKPEITFQSKNS